MPRATEINSHSVVGLWPFETKHHLHAGGNGGDHADQTFLYWPEKLSWRVPRAPRVHGESAAGGPWHVACRWTRGLRGLRGTPREPPVHRRGCPGADLEADGSALGAAVETTPQGAHAPKSVSRSSLRPARGPCGARTLR